MMKQTTASFDVDSQKAFTPLCPDELPAPGGTEIANELNLQARFAAYRLGSKDAHPANPIWLADPQHPAYSKIEGNNVDLRWPKHAVPGTQGFELIPGLPPVTEYDYFVWKGVEPDMHPYGACYHDFAEKISTGAIEFLKMRHVETIIVGGLVTDYCVKTTVLQFIRAGFKVIVNLGACRGVQKDTTEAAITLMKNSGARIIASAQELQP